jgi:hypothetical protein
MLPVRDYFSQFFLIVAIPVEVHMRYYTPIIYYQELPFMSLTAISKSIKISEVTDGFKLSILTSPLLNVPSPISERGPRGEVIKRPYINLKIPDRPVITSERGRGIG